MKATARPFAPPRVHVARSRPALWAWIALGGLAVGSADMLFAMAWWAQSDAPPARILQSIWAWFVGREAAFAGGALTAFAGAAVYFVLMSMIVAIYHAAPPKRFLPDWNLACLLAHMLLIGIPAAWMSRRWYGGMR